MKNFLERNELKGVYVALLSPIDSYGDLDIEYLKNIIKLQSNYVQGYVLFGSTGQNPCFSWEEQLENSKIISEYIEGELKPKEKQIIFCVSSNNTEEALRNMEEYESIFSKSTFLTATGYYNKPGQEGQIEHYNSLTKSIQGNLIVYEVPSRTSGTKLEKGSWERLNLEKIIGIKDATEEAGQKGRIQFFKEKNIAYLTGEDVTFTDTIKYGGQGTISAASNVNPEIFSDVLEKIENTTREKIGTLSELVFCVSNPIPLAYFFYTYLRSPLTLKDLSTDNKEKIDNYLENNQHCVAGLAREMVIKDYYKD